MIFKRILPVLILAFLCTLIYTSSNNAQTSQRISILDDVSELPGDMGFDIASRGGFLNIFVDDGFAWTHEFSESLLAINTDLGLRNTPWEMGFTVVVNARLSVLGGGNFISGYDGNSVSSTYLTPAQMKALAATGFVEIGSHGYTADIADTYGSGVAANTITIPSYRKSLPDSGNFRTHYFDNVKVIRDSIGATPEVFTHAQNGHRFEPIAKYYAIKAGIKNFRTGTWRHKPNESFSTSQIAFSSLTDDVTANGTSGRVVNFNRNNLDVFSYWKSNWDPNSIPMYTFGSPYFMRTYMAHHKPGAVGDTLWGNGPSNDGTGFVTDAERYDEFTETIYRLADEGNFCIFVLHNITTDTGSENQQQNFYSGTAGVDTLASIFRNIIGPMSQNGLFGYDGPTLKAGKTNEMVMWQKKITTVDRPIDMIGNPWLSEGNLDDDVPFGFQPWIALNIWADSSWNFVDSTECVAAGGWFGMENNSGILGGTTDESTGLFHNLVLGVFPVTPNRKIDFSFYASISKLRSQAAGDYLGAEWLACKITEYRWNGDPTDSTFTFDITGDSDGPEEQVFDPGARDIANDYLLPTDVNGDIFFEGGMFMGRFHSDDDWDNVRTNMSGSITGLQRMGYTGSTDEGQRWKPFINNQFRVGPYTDWIKIEIIPMGFTAHPSPGATAAGKDSLAISGIVMIETD